MITKILIKNFQSHKRTLLDLSKGINILEGISDKGKTVIIRAIRWVVYNKPSGDDFRSYWGGDTIVELTFDDGTVVTRVKTNTSNHYILNGEKLKAFGQGVPDEVIKVLNLEEVNIQQQMDAPFLLSETAGEVASHFNKIAGISIIDKSIARAKKEVADTKSSITQREEDLEEKKKQLEQYSTLEVLEKKVQQLDKKDKERVKLKGEIVIIGVKRNRVIAIDNTLIEVSALLALEASVNNVLERKTLLEKTEQEIERITNLIKKLKRVDASVIEMNAVLTQEQVVTTLLSKHSKRSQFQRDLSTLRTLVGKYTRLTNKVQENDENILKLNAALPNVCPMCKGTGKLK